MTPNKYGLVFDHLGLAVKSPDAATRFLGDLGYEIGTSVFDPIQKVNLIMCRHNAMPAVEIIFPGDDSGPVDRLLAQHREGLVYHMCFRTQDLDASLAAMADDAGLRAFCVAPPEQAVLFGGQRVSFYVVDGVGLIELLEDPGFRPA
jgi:hypothetical protein